jgi:sarcosine oxidase
MQRAVAPEEAASTHRDHVAGRLRGVGPRALRSAACLYTVAPDSDFVVGRHPDRGRVIVVSACPGHGFKHSPAPGEAVAELAVEGRSRIDLSTFAWARLNPAT